MQQSVLPAPVFQACYSISWAHSMATLNLDPTATILPRMVVEAAKRKMGKQVMKKEPINIDILKNLVQLGTYNVKDLRVVLMCVVSFAAFLRYNEMAAIRRCDIVFNNNHLELFIKKAKNNVYREDNKVAIVRTNNSTCPYTLLQKYCQMANI